MVMGGCCEEEREHWWLCVSVVRKRGRTGGHGWVFEEERKHWWSWVGV